MEAHTFCQCFALEKYLERWNRDPRLTVYAISGVYGTRDTKTWIKAVYIILSFSCQTHNTPSFCTTETIFTLLLSLVHKQLHRTFRT